MQPIAYFFFCGECGPREGKKPRVTLILRHVQVDVFGTMLFSLLCTTCGDPVQVTWSIEENMAAMEQAKEQMTVSDDEIQSFLDELDEDGP